MITLVTEAGVDSGFLTTTDVSGLVTEIPAQSEHVDILMNELHNKMGSGELVPWADVEGVVYADSSTGAPGPAKVDSITHSQSQTTAASVYIVKKLLAEQLAVPTVRINGKPLTGDVTLALSDFSLYTAAEIDAKFASPTPAGPILRFDGAEDHSGVTAEPLPGGVLTNLRMVNGQWVGTYAVLKVLQRGGVEIPVAYR